MNTSSLHTLYPRLQTLAIFRALLNDPVIQALCTYLQRRETADTTAALSAYAAFVAELYNSGADSLGSYVQQITGDDENCYIRQMGRGQTPAPALAAALEEELATLQAVADLTPETLREGLAWDGFLPSFPVQPVLLHDTYHHRAAHIGQYGYGIYARHAMFYIDSQNTIVPVRHPDRTRLSSLVDYKREQSIILDNTRALLAGKPASNILLTGDAGTGKSSTIKAVINELHDQGLRILEVRKEQLREIPAIWDELSANPLKFILFIDDLSFQKGDDTYSALKAILEGSVTAKSPNVVIYATSNRRHLVKESFSDRDGDDIHRNDTVQEVLSLSERFGIQITFQKPDKQTYLDIVHHLAAERGAHCPTEELDALAERFALARGGRSARAATQFVDGLLAKQE